jgi:tetratricopeptide (TPR) repeat protein
MILGVVSFPAYLESRMVVHKMKSAAFVLAIGCVAMLPDRLLAQGNGSGMVVNTPLSGGLTRSIAIVDLDLQIKGPNGGPIEEMALVTITKLNGQIYRQSTARAGYVRINELPQSEYNVLVVAPGFGRVTKLIDTHTLGATLMKVSIQLEPAPEGEDAVTDTELAALAPKAQKAVGKAIESLRSNKLPEARSQLETAYRVAPTSAEVNYLFGVYSLQMSDRVQAKSYWTKTLELYPNHYRALLSLSQALLDEDKPGEALPYLKRAVRAEPSSWRAHAIYADAYLRQGSPDEAVKQAERALELGHGKAAIVERYLAAALAKCGEKDRAASVLQTYVKEHPADTSAKKQLENLQLPEVQKVQGAADAPSMEMVQPGSLAEATALPLPSNWLPPDVDEIVPPVEPGAACQIDDVLRQTGKRIEEFVGNVDRFTATEFLTHESINKWGMASSPEQRKFEYVVSVQEVAPGFLNVDEYRSNSNNSPVDFPDGVESTGLPAQVLIFHPYNVGNFELSCEGLTRWNGGLAWQVHFRQRKDKPNRIREYKLGMDGPSYPVALKGRAWIAADSFQIMRLETDLVAPIPEIRLVVDHTAVEYSPVYFKNRKVNMWLPQTAEVYYYWKGRRIHLHHRFNNYLLFAVDDKQRISAPKIAEETPAKTSSETVRQKP